MTTTPTTTTSGAADLAARLRNACTSVRSKSYPLADLIPLMQQAADALASATAQAAEPSITLDFKMATELLWMFCGEPGLVTLQRGDEHCHSGPGLYAWYSDMPEEGAGFLGAEPDDEATPSAPSAPAQHTRPCVVCGSDEPFTGTCGSGDPRALCKQPTSAPAADSVQEDAALWHWIAEYLVGTRTDLDDEIVACETVNDLRKLVESAIKQGEKQ